MKDIIRTKALELGFDDVGFAKATVNQAWSEDLGRWLDLGHHGQMGWMEPHRDRRASPQGLWAEVRTVISLALSYAPAPAPATVIDPYHSDRGVISVYARGQDYHDVVKAKLKALARWMVQDLGGDVKVFVDTAPVMEKPLAATTALGWQGRHTNLVSRHLGNWFFIGEIYSTLDIAADAPHSSYCGSCHACQTACPTGALEHGRMDARKCISYLTIEHKGHIPAGLRIKIGNRIYGCDDCLAACPWNKFAKPTVHQAFAPRAELMAPCLTDLAQLDDVGFRSVFSGSPIKRIGRDRMVRNVLIAIGNSGQSGALSVVTGLLADDSPLVRAMAVWALRQLTDDAGAEPYRTRSLAVEDDDEVRNEWL